MQPFNLPLNPFNKLSRPLQEIGDLNLKTLQKLSYINPQDLSQMRDPKVLLDRNVQIFITNSRTSLDYIHQLFNILEDSLVHVSRDLRDKAQDFVQESQMMTEAVKKAAARTMPRTSQLKKSGKSPIKKAMATSKSTATAPLAASTASASPSKKAAKKTKTTATAKKPALKTTATKKTAPKKLAAKKAVAKKVVAKKAVAKSAVTKKAVAKKAVAKKVVAKKAVAKKAVAKKAAAPKLATVMKKTLRSRPSPAASRGTSRAGSAVKSAASSLKKQSKSGPIGSKGKMKVATHARSKVAKKA